MTLARRLDTDAVPAWRTPIPFAVWILTALLAACFFSFPEAIATSGLDESWVQSLGHFFKHRSQIGVDYIFTYGPYGFFIHRMYDSDLFWISYAWELCLKSLCAFFIVWVSLHAPGLWKLLLIGIAAIVFEPGVPEAQLYVSLVAAFISLVKQPGHLRLLVVSAALLIAVISLIKFTFFVYVVVALPFVEFAYRRKHRGVWLSPLVCCLLFGAGIWVAAGQDLRNFPRYVHRSLQIAAGYSEAMASPAGPAELALGVAAAIVLALLLISVTIWPRLDAERVAGLVIFGACLLLTWKHGFTRGDPVHNAVFFITALFLAGFVPVYFVTSKLVLPVGLAAAGSCMLICAIGLNRYTSIAELVSRRPHSFMQNVKNAINPMALRAELETQRAALARTWSLPLIRARVRDAPVDLFSYEQGVILLNQLNYVSRPVLHSYSAYTPRLLAANREFLRGPRAPQFVLYRFSTIDGVFPTLADSAAFFELLWRYRPVLGERSVILLEQCPERPHEHRAVGNILIERPIGFDQRLQIPAEADPWLTLALQIKPSFLGRMKSFLYKPGRISIQIDTGEGESLSFRLIPAVAQNEFLIKPFIADRNDVLNLYGNLPGKTIRSFRVTCDDPKSYDPEIGVTIRGYQRLVGCPIDSKLLAELRSQPEEIRHFDGSVDVVDAHHIVGWAIDKNMPDDPVNVDIYVDDELVAVIPANEPRPGIDERGIGAHAFVLQTPDAIKDGRPHVVRVQPAGSSQQLRGSPRTVILGTR